MHTEHTRRHAAGRSIGLHRRSLGTLVGADLLNLARVQGLGAPLVSIEGAGTFDGIFLTSVLSVELRGCLIINDSRKKDRSNRQSSTKSSTLPLHVRSRAQASR
jgi:hypothetical protein